MADRPAHRARRSFWLLVGVAVLATGGLSWAVEAPRSPFTGVAFASSALVLVAAVALAARILIAFERDGPW